MDKLDTLVVDYLSRDLLTTERLTGMLASLSSRRASRAAEVDGRVATLQRDATDAEDKLKRLYKMVEDGVADMNDLLKERIGTLKLERERSQAALDRIRATNVPASTIPVGGNRAVRPRHAREHHHWRSSVPQGLSALGRRPH